MAVEFLAAGGLEALFLASPRPAKPVPPRRGLSWAVRSLGCPVQTGPHAKWCFCPLAVPRYRPSGQRRSGFSHPAIRTATRCNLKAWGRAAHPRKRGARPDTPIQPSHRNAVQPQSLGSRAHDPGNAGRPGSGEGKKRCATSNWPQPRPRPGLSPSGAAPRQQRGPKTPPPRSRLTTDERRWSRCAHVPLSSQLVGSPPTSVGGVALTIRHHKPRRATLLASPRPQVHPATTGLVPVERCSSPARAQSFPPRRGLSPSSAAPRQHASPAPPRHDGACPRRALLLASTRPQSFPPRRGLSPSSAAPRQHASPSPSRHDGACPRRALLLASPRSQVLPATTGLVPSSDAPRHQCRPTSA